jgi:hypothetical protein
MLELLAATFLLASGCAPPAAVPPPEPEAPPTTPPTPSTEACETVVTGPERELRVDALDGAYDIQLIALDDGEIGCEAFFYGPAGGSKRVMARVSGEETVPVGGLDLLEVDPSIRDMDFAADGSMWEVSLPAGAPPKLGRRDARGFTDLTFGESGAVRFGETVPRTVGLVVDPKGRPLVILDYDAILRGTIDGRVDPSFNGGQPVWFDAWSLWLAFFPDGRILQAEQTSDSYLEYTVLLEDGTPDLDFPAGAVELRPDEDVNDLLAEADGALVASEVFTPGEGIEMRSRLRRIRTDGTWEWVRDLRVPSRPDQGFEAQRIRRDGTGHLLVFGYLFPSWEPWIMRLRPDLSPDPCFGPAGDGFTNAIGFSGSVSRVRPNGSVAVGLVYDEGYLVFAAGPAQ